VCAARTFVHKGRMTRFRRNVKINSERLRISEDVTIKTEGLKGIKGAILSSEGSREHLTQRPTRQDDQLQSNETQLRTLTAVSNAVTMSTFILQRRQDKTPV